MLRQQTSTCGRRVARRTPSPRPTQEGSERRSNEDLGAVERVSKDGTVVAGIGEHHAIRVAGVCQRKAETDFRIGQGTM